MTLESWPVTFVTSRSMPALFGSSLTTVLSTDSFARSPDRWAVVEGVRGREGLRHERAGQGFGHRSTPPDGLRAGAPAQDERLLQLRGLLHDHLDPVGLSDPVLLRHDQRGAR